MTRDGLNLQVPSCNFSLSFSVFFPSKTDIHMMVWNICYKYELRLNIPLSRFGYMYFCWQSFQFTIRIKTQRWLTSSTSTEDESRNKESISNHNNDNIIITIIFNGALNCRNAQRVLEMAVKWISLSSQRCFFPMCLHLMRRIKFIWLCPHFLLGIKLGTVAEKRQHQMNCRVLDFSSQN